MVPLATTFGNHFHNAFVAAWPRGVPRHDSRRFAFAQRAGSNAAKTSAISETRFELKMSCNFGFFLMSTPRPEKRLSKSGRIGAMMALLHKRSAPKIAINLVATARHENAVDKTSRDLVTRRDSNGEICRAKTSWTRLSATTESARIGDADHS